MITQLYLLRKQYVSAQRSRVVGDSIHALSEEVFAVSNPEPEIREKCNRLQTERLALLDSIEANIPWFLKYPLIKK